MIRKDLCAEYGTSHQLGKIGDSIRIWANIDPDILLAVFLPALLFESSFSMEMHQIKRCMAQMLLLAGPGVLISTFCLGPALKASNRGLSVVLPDGPWREPQLGWDSQISGTSLSWIVVIEIALTLAVNYIACFTV
ncbi:hypothetical protein GH714_007766 [Hevea brasiliensis]|uniref:Cation/H+ exchanger transmembrane domain-containing protein n=1 Tax=Hevea brasiliensis TaxID=3981 RepID=A0A6A6LW95_HEVBR|nr:hypothetical protein GH714_007766 [Hevea brasiliensis]